MSARTIPRPVTAGRQRPSSASQNAGVMTPRGTSSVSAYSADGLASNTSEKESALAVDENAARSAASTSLASATRRVVTYADVCVQTADCDTTRYLAERDRETAARNAATAALDAAARALESRVSHAEALAAALKSRDAAQRRSDALEVEIRELRSSMAKKHDELLHVKKQVQQAESRCKQPSSSQFSSRQSRIVVLDTTCLLLQSPLQQQQHYVAAAADAKSIHTIHLDDAAGGGCRQRNVVDAASTTSALERMKRDWKHSQQRQPVGSGSVEALSDARLSSPVSFAGVQQLLGGIEATASREVFGGGDSALSETVADQSKQTKPVSVEPFSVSSLSTANEAIEAQCEIIKSLEKENTLLRAQRDEAHAQSQREHQRLMQELDEAHQTLDVQGAGWNEKQKELNRLRTLMRFSQLKRDSDKLQETYARLDELENKLRQLHAEHHREALERDDLQRLRVIEMQLKKLLRGEIPWSAFPKELLYASSKQAQDVARASAPQPQPLSSCAAPQKAAADSKPTTITAATAAHLPVRPSTAKLFHTQQRNPLSTPSIALGVTTVSSNRLQNVPDNVVVEPTTHAAVISKVVPLLPKRDNSVTGLPQTDDGFEIGVDEDEADDVPTPREAKATAATTTSTTTATRPNLSRGAALDEEQPASEASVAARDEDVSFSTITERMQAYLQRRARQQQLEQQAAQRSKDASAAGDKRAAQQRAPLVEDTSSNSMSTFGRRLERLRSSITSQGSQSRPQSASRPVATSAYSYVLPTPSQTHQSHDASSRPSSASVAGKRSASTAAIPVDPTTANRQYAYIGGRMVPVR